MMRRSRSVQRRGYATLLGISAIVAALLLMTGTLLQRADDAHHTARLTHDRTQARLALEAAQIALSTGKWKPGSGALTVGMAQVEVTTSGRTLIVTIPSAVPGQRSSLPPRWKEVYAIPSVSPPLIPAAESRRQP